MSEEKAEPDFKSLLQNLTDDARYHDHAILNGFPGQNSVDILYYSRLNMEGDGYQIVRSDSTYLSELHRTMITTAVQGRIAFWTFIAEAIS